MVCYLGAAEVDQRQHFILQADKLREVLGASQLISETSKVAEDVVARFPGVEIVAPVSGAIKLTASDLIELTKCLWQLRERFQNKLFLQTTFAVCQAEDGHFTKAIDELERRVRRLKDSKVGEEAPPASPYFAQCRIQPQQAANIWHPKALKDREPRRSLVSHESEERVSWPLIEKKFRSKLLARSRHKQLLKEPREFNDLVASPSDSYIALIKSDIDGMGRLQAELDWDKLGKQLGKDAPHALREFAEAVNDSLEKAIIDAIDDLTDPKTNKKYFPFAPILCGGDDVWVLAQRDLALKFADSLEKKFGTNVAGKDVLKQAFDLTGVERLTLSFGVLYAQQGYPFDQQLELAEELLRNAKNHRREQNSDEGCIDFHWLESSGRESIKTAREEAYGVKDNHTVYRLFTRPWTVDEASKFVEAARTVQARLPRRKLHQLETILKLGGDLSELAFKQWRLRLEEEQREDLKNAVNQLPANHRIDPAQGPWVDRSGEKQTPLLDLVELAEIQHRDKAGRATAQEVDRL